MNNNLSKKNSFHIAYRPDIDGIRAIAVLLVLAFHAFPENFKGGFLGVDIFFVISGYLISSIILGGLNNDTYSLKNFYLKRVNRIFPALLTVLIFSLVLGWFGLIPEEYKELGRHSASASFFVSNITLWYQSGYFDTSSDLKPLLHLWSLAVEEQFYIFWPLIITFFWKRKSNLVKVTVFIIIVSFLINVFMSYNYHSGAFYSPMSRFWEILLGAYLALLKSDGINTHKKSKSNLQSCLGFLLIIISVAFVTKKSFFPGFWAICPTVGTCLIISSGPSAWLNKYILSNKMLVGIGLISYPLYLWHWPLISFAKIMTSEPLSSILKITLLIFSFILAWITYKYLELPLRRIKDTKTKTLILLGLLLSIGILGAIIKGNKGIRSRDFNEFNNYSNLSSGFTGVSCDIYNLKMKTSNYCTKYKDTNILLVGDSHAAQLYYGLLHSGDNYFNKVSVLAGVSCNGLLNYYNDNNCENYIEAIFNTLDNNPSIKYVIIAGSHQSIEGQSPFNIDKYFKGYSDMIKALHKKGVTPVFFIDNLALKRDPLECYESKLALRKSLSSLTTYCKDLKEENWLPNHNYERFVTRLSLKFPRVLFFNPQPLLCKNNKCSLFKEDKLLYSDFNHYSKYGSLIVGKKLALELNLQKGN